MTKDEMTLGQYFEFIRAHPDDKDGFILEQKINRVIGAEFKRIQSKVDIAYSGHTQTYNSMKNLSQRIDLINSQVGRVQKFDVIVESLNRLVGECTSKIANINSNISDNEQRSRSTLNIVSARTMRNEGEIQFIKKWIENPPDGMSEMRTVFD